MSSFTHEQVAYFRQTFSQFSESEDGGISRENFILAVTTSWEGASVSGRPPSVGRLNDEFNRLSADGGAVQWQQFFQVLIHLNLNRSESPEPPEVPPHRTTSYIPPEVPQHMTESGNRVQFAESVQEEEAPPPSYDAVEEQDRTNTIGRQLLRSVGNFFGVTETSQRGGNGRIGWEEFNERHMDEPGLLSTLSRRASLRNRQQQVPVPDFPAGRSFDMAELGGDSDEEEAGLTVAAPPSYNDVFVDPTSGGNAAPSQQYPEPTRQRQQESRVRQDLIYNKAEAWAYYQNYIKAEKRIRQRRHRTDAYDFFGSAGAEATDGIRSGSQQRNQDSSDGVVRRPKKKKKTKLQRQSTLIRTEVESLPTFWPVFIILVTISQVLTLIVLMSLYGLAPIKPSLVREVGEFDSLASSTTMQNITYYRAVNIWIGPSQLNLIRLGAKFTPCMRSDFAITNRLSRDFGNVEQNFGCCENQGLVGTSKVSNADCYRDNTNETRFTPGQLCSNFSIAGIPNLHPCCISILGHCGIMRMDECDARGGTYHIDKSDCQEVNCFRSICGFNGLLVSELSVDDVPSPLMPNPQQFWRFFTSMFMHLGVIHIILLIPVQLYIGIKIERTIGWLRTGIIYIISGVGGNLVSAIFIPYGVNAGSSGAVFGLLGVLFVELFQFWQIVDRAWLELIKLLAFVVFLLALGTLPYVDNMAHIGGLIYGVPAAIIFVPYITFGKFDAARKRILLIICIPLLLALLLFGFLTFYLIKDNSFCSFCHYINCIPYVSNFCPDGSADPTIFAL